MTALWSCGGRSPKLVLSVAKELYEILHFVQNDPAGQIPHGACPEQNIEILRLRLRMTGRRVRNGNILRNLRIYNFLYMNKNCSAVAIFNFVISYTYLCFILLL